MVPPSTSSYGILASLSFMTTAASSSVLNCEKATALSEPWPTVLTTITSPISAAATTPRPIRWMLLSPRQTRRRGWSMGCRLSICVYRFLDTHPHDFCVGVDQLVTDLKGHRKAETRLFGIEHHLVQVDRFSLGEG